MGPYWYMVSVCVLKSMGPYWYVVYNGYIRIPDLRVGAQKTIKTIRISHSGSKAQKKGDTRNLVL